jgi:glycosyltransferase involved in cell wall biosynthesis
VAEGAAARRFGARSQRSSYDDSGTSLPTCEGFRPVAFPPRLLSVFRDVTAGRAVCDDAARASDLPEHKPVFSTFSSIPLVSISNAQRRPVPNAKWIGTVYHGLPENLLKAEPTIPSYLAFLGRISREKPVDRAVRTAERCGLPLKIAAKVDAADQDYFVETILPLLSKPHVDFIGEITDAQKSEFLSGAVALIVPIDWPEPFGLVMIEAMACGTPVIAFNRGSVPEVIKDGLTGFVVEEETSAVGAIRQLSRLSRTVIRKRFEEQFTARRMAEQYLRLYRI